MRKFLAFLLLSAFPLLLGGVLVNSYQYSTTAAGLKTNLVAYWKLDEAPGASAIDSHGTKTLTNVGTVGTTTGKINGARVTTVGNYLTRSDDVDFEPGAGPWFATMWAKPSSMAQGFPTIFGKYAASTGYEWAVNMHGTNLCPYVEISTNGTSTFFEVQAAANSFPNTATWVFIAVGGDGTSLKISVNGGAFVSTAFSGTILAGTQALQIGARGGGNEFQGATDEIAFWKGRCLTLPEVQQIYGPSGVGLPYSSW